jgi:hypothetical protein
MVIRYNDIVIDRAKLQITVRSKVRQFQKQPVLSTYSHHRNIFFATVEHLVLNGWTRKQALWDYLYGRSADGGPDNGLKVLDIRFHQFRPALADLNLRIVREKRGGHIWYKVVST